MFFLCFWISDVFYAIKHRISGVENMIPDMKHQNNSFSDIGKYTPKNRAALSVFGCLFQRGVAGSMVPRTPHSGRVPGA